MLIHSGIIKMKLFSYGKDDVIWYLKFYKFKNNIKLIFNILQFKKNINIIFKFFYILLKITKLQKIEIIKYL